MEKDVSVVRTYLSFASWGAETPVKDGFADGEALAAGCHKELSKSGDRTQFPPRLLILMASPKYLEGSRAQELVQGIENYFMTHYHEHVPLIGSSVAAVCFKRQAHEHGAVLICLASKSLQVCVEATDVPEQPREAIETLCSRLGVAISDDQDPNPLANRMLLVFLPGQLAGNPPMSLYNYITKAIGHKIHVTGGVSHPASGEGPGFQFTHFGVQQGAIVAARIEFGICLASGLARSCLRGLGVYTTRRNCYSKPHIELDSDTTVEDIVSKRGFVLLGKEVDNRYVALVTHDRTKSSPRKLGNVRERESLEVLDVDESQITNEAVYAITEPRRLTHMKNPIGAITFHCASYYRYREKIGLNIGEALGRMEEAIGNAPIVGGFFDGEIGVADDGRSMLANWVGATLTFGDEMRERAVWQQVLMEIANFSGKLNKAQSLEQVISLSLEMVHKAGYPGAMISFIFPDWQEDWAIAKGAFGERFSKIKDFVQVSWQDEEPLVAVALGRKPRYIASWDDWAKAEERKGKEQAAWHRGLVSQYVIPLFGRNVKNGFTNQDVAPLLGPIVKTVGYASLKEDREVLGFLHIDLGDSSKKSRLKETEERVLDALGAAVESSLLHVLIWEEANVRQALDKGLGEALVANSETLGRRKLLEAAMKAFGGYSAYIRMRNGKFLELVDGFGAYYDATRHVRPQIDITDQSPSGQTFALGAGGAVNNSSVMHRQLCGRYSGGSDKDRKMTDALREVGAYVSSVLKDQFDQKVGTVMIVAKQPWRFHRFHINCLRIMGRLLSSVTEHLEETSAARFVQQIEDDLPARVNSPADLDHALRVLVDHVKRALGAQVACIFLWDEMVDRFILRAQVGWHQSRWEGAAYYEKLEGWTGSVALADEPRYEENLIKYKDFAGSPPQGAYEDAMMGGPPNEQLTAGVGLPLRAGAKLLGILTAFTRYENKGTGELFAIADPKVLAQAASQIEGYVSSLLLQRYERLEKERRERHGAIHRTVAASATEFGAVLCRQLCELYRAEKALFYAWDKDTVGLACAASYPDGRERVDDLLKEVAQNQATKFIPIPFVTEERGDPEKAATHGAISRACLSVLAEGELLGLLDLHWPNNLRRSEHVLQYGTDELKVIVTMVGSVYKRHRLQADLARAKEREKNLEPRVRHWAGLIAEYSKGAVHQCAQIGPHLVGLESLILEGCSQDSVLKRLREIKSKAASIRDILKDMPSPKDPDFLERVESVSYPMRESIDLTVLIQQAIDASESPGDIYWTAPRDEKLIVNVSRESVAAAFLNFINNAIQTVNRKRAQKKSASIAISVVALREEKKVEIVFKDTGEGMELRQIEDAMQGKTPPLDSNGHGVGLPAATAMLQVFGGTVNIKSQPKFGTEVVVTLPLAPGGAE
ncbi:MAG TPA: ATP-binding protein [Candidatus Angelobacter sp.]